MNQPPAPSRAARRVGVVVVALAVILTVFATAKHFAMGGLADSEIAAGEAAIAQAVKGDGDLGAARSAFRDAASVSVLDYYPAFGLSVVERLSELEGGATAERPGDDVLVAIWEKDWERARKAVDAMRDEDSGRAEYYDRLVEGVRQASMKAE